MKEMKNISNIGFVFENCEIIDGIGAEYFDSVLFADIDEGVVKAGNSISLIKTVDYVMLGIDERAKKLEYLPFGETSFKTNIFDRLSSYNDITRIILNYEDGTSETLLVNWGEDDDTENSLQQQCLYDGKLYIVISNNSENAFDFLDDNDDEEIEEIERKQKPKKHIDKQVYIINGKPQAGKDTFVKFVGECAEDVFGLTVNNISTVDDVKLAALLLGWDGEKDEKGRKFLSDLKALSSAAYNGPLTSVIDEIKNDNSDIFFVHCREPEEIKKLKEMLSDIDITAKTVFIKNSRVEGQYNNASDDNVHNFSYDITVENEKGLEEFKNTARFFVMCNIPKV